MRSGLKDNATIVYMSEAVKPRALYSFHYINVSTGPAGAAFGANVCGADTLRGQRGDCVNRIGHKRDRRGCCGLIYWPRTIRSWPAEGYLRAGFQFRLAARRLHIT